MASINKKAPAEIVHTHGGAPTYAVSAEEELCRAVMSNLLWEDSHYESGESIADRIKGLIPKVDPLRVAQMAIDARSLMHLRHVPLLLAREMARLDTHKHLVSRLLPEIIQRPDELTELVAIYWKDKKEPLSAQIKKGLAKAFVKFNEYSLSKYANREGAISLRDVLFLTRPISTDSIQKELWRKLAQKELKAPESWEVTISAKGNNKESWEGLLKNNALGAFAFIRNLRNMVEANVDHDLVRKYFLTMKGIEKILPFRYLSAATHAPKFEPELEQVMFKSIAGKEKLPGKTVLVVDVSGSMYNTKVSEKSEMDRAKAACALAVIARELCDNVAIYATAGSDSSRIHKTQLVPSRRGFALSDAIYGMCRPLGGGGIFLEQVMSYVKEHEKTADRIIIITDEQDCSGQKDAPARADAFGTHNYIINVNTYEHGIGYGKWTHINGWSEAVLDFIRLSEEGYKPKKISQALLANPIPAKPQKKEKAYAKKTTGTKKSSRSTKQNVPRNGRIRKSK